MYFSQRIKAKLEPDQHLGQDFFVAFKAYVDKLLEKEFFLHEAFPNKVCGFGGIIWYDYVHLRMQLQQEIGAIDWPLTPASFPESTKLLDVVEFFYRKVAAPVGYGPCRCGSEHPYPSFNQQKARSIYLKDINQMFQSFNHPYELLPDGEVRLKNSVILDSWIWHYDFKTNDEELLQLIKSALENFYDKSGTRKLDGLKNIVAAFERLKTTLETGDKKQSVTKVIENLSPDPKVQALYEGLFRNLTDLSNFQNIRHSEKDKAVLHPQKIIP